MEASARAEMVRYVHRAGRFARLGGVALLSLLGAYGYLRLPHATWLAWVALALVMIVVRSGWMRAYQQQDPASADREVSRWERRVILGSLATGLVWALGVWLCFDAERLDAQVLMLAATGLLSMASIGVLAAVRRAYLCQVAPVHAALALAFASTGRRAELAVAALVMLGLVVFAGFARQYERLLRESFSIRFERERLLAELAARTREAEEANASKTRFLASASHDLRQPLHALGLLTGSLAAGPGAPPQAEPIRQVVRSLDELVGSLLDISRLDAGAAPPALQPVALQPMFERLGAEFAVLADERGLQLRCRPTGLAVLSDAPSLERMLRNLLANALRYTEAGGVLLAARRRGGQVQVGIWDTGPGIEPAQQAAVFEEFVQLANPGRDQRRGLGLGLAIVRRLAAPLGHAVTLRSRPGQGSCFAVMAAASETVPATEPADAEAGETTPAGPLEGLVIALVEDDEATRAATAELLAGWGARVLQGASAAELLRPLGARPIDLVVSDLRLAEGDGLQAIAALRRAAGRGDLPALLLSGDPPPAAELQALGIRFARKPVPPARLRVLIADVLGASAEQVVAGR